MKKRMYRCVGVGSKSNREREREALLVVRREIWMCATRDDGQPCEMGLRQKIAHTKYAVRKVSAKNKKE